MKLNIIYIPHYAEFFFEIEINNLHNAGVINLNLRN